MSNERTFDDVMHTTKMVTGKVAMIGSHINYKPGIHLKYFGLKTENARKHDVYDEVIYHNDATIDDDIEMGDTVAATVVLPYVDENGYKKSLVDMRIL